LIDVDEEDFLIATDIDKLIDILSTRKEVEVGKLSKELRMNRKEVEKWLHILEEEGVVTLVHRMGSLHASWVMDKAPAPRKPKYSKPKKEEPEEIELQMTEEAPADLGEQIGQVASLRPKQKSIFSGILGKNQSRKPPKRGRKEVPRLTIDEEDEVVVEEAPAPRPPRRVEEAPPRPPRKVEALPPMAVVTEPSKPMKKKLEKSKYLNLHPRHTGQLRERLDDYLFLIREGKEEIKTLESEKERVHREGFLSLEKEFEATLDNLEYALLEKEKRILEAKERMATLPEKIEEIDQMQEALKKFDTEAGAVLSKTKKGLDDGWSNLREASEELNDELGKGEDEVMRDRSRMMQLRDMLQSMNHTESQLKETLEAGRAALEDMEEKVRTVEESLDDLVDSRAIISERVEHIQSTLERRMHSLEDLRGELEKIEKIEEWFKDYSDDYQGKMDEIQEYVQQSEEELERIKKAAEIDYVRKYLKELDVAEGKYRENLGALEMEDSGIDEKITDVRDRIKQLMRESSELMSNYRQMSEEGEEFEEVVATAREKSRRHKASIEEKSSQRKRLMEDAKKLQRSPKKSSKKKARKKRK
jgi:methyl-accepting chemotaxis protein